MLKIILFFVIMFIGYSLSVSTTARIVLKDLKNSNVSSVLYYMFLGFLMNAAVILLAINILGIKLMF